MMNKSLFVIPALIIFVHISCKKNEDIHPPQNNPTQSLVKSISVSDSIGNIMLSGTYFYDILDRLTSISETLYTQTVGYTIFNYNFDLACYPIFNES